MKFKSMFVLALLFCAVNISAFDVTGDHFDAKFKITSVTLGEKYSIINAESDAAGQYGKVWLTYNLKADNPGNPNQGSFSGRATAIDENGNRNGASRQGVWERKGTVMHFRSLDDVSDGNQYLCITAINLINDSLKMSFYSTK